MSLKSPSDFLKNIIGHPVNVKLNSGIDYQGRNNFRHEGKLVCLDGYMNIVLEKAEEKVNGVIKHKYGDSFIRGNNGKNKF